MVNSPTCESQAGLKILRFQVRKVAQHLFRHQSAGKEIENVGDADTHPTHAGAPPALLRIDRDSLCQIRHCILLVSIMPDSSGRPVANVISLEQRNTVVIGLFNTGYRGGREARPA